MADVDKLKRHLVRAVVQENIEIIERRGPRALLRRQRRWRVGLHRVLVGAVACGFFAFPYVFSTIPTDHREITNPSPPVARAMGTRAPSLAAPAEKADVPEIGSRPKEIEAPLPLVHKNRTAESSFLAPRRADLNVFALPVRKIVIDPGHGGEDPGAVATHAVVEKEITLDIGQRLRCLLEESAFHVRMTREKDEMVSLEQRSAFANAASGDLFVSIHVNWLKRRRARVVETYYLGPTTDPVSLRIASTENRQSGYSLADFRQLLEGVYSGVRRDESRKLAEAVQGELVRSLRETNPTLKNRAVKTAPFAVLVAADMPAILTEVSCLSNDEEVRLLANPDYRQQIAQALFAGIRFYADTLNQPNEKGS